MEDSAECLNVQVQSHTVSVHSGKLMSIASRYLLLLMCCTGPGCAVLPVCVSRRGRALQPAPDLRQPAARKRPAAADAPRKPRQQVTLKDMQELTVFWLREIDLNSSHSLILFGNSISFVSYFTSMRPNIFLGVSDGSAQYRKWYYEVIVDQALPFVTAEPTHLRVGWANTSGYAPYPSGGEGWGGNGVGDDLFSYGFDGLHLWSGEGGRMDALLLECRWILIDMQIYIHLWKTCTPRVQVASLGLLVHQTSTCCALRMWSAAAWI